MHILWLMIDVRVCVCVFQCTVGCFSPDLSFFLSVVDCIHGYIHKYIYA